MKRSIRTTTLAALAGMALAASGAPAFAAAPSIGASTLDKAFGGRKVDVECDDVRVITDPNKADAGDVAEFTGDVILKTDDINLRCEKLTYDSVKSLVNAFAGPNKAVEITMSGQGFIAYCDLLAFNPSDNKYILTGNARVQQKSEGNDMQIVGDKITVTRDGEDMKVDITRERGSGGKRPHLVVKGDSAGKGGEAKSGGGLLGAKGPAAAKAPAGLPKLPAASAPKGDLPKAELPKLPAGGAPVAPRANPIVVPDTSSAPTATRAASDLAVNPLPAGIRPINPPAKNPGAPAGR